MLSRQAFRGDDQQLRELLARSLQMPVQTAKPAIIPVFLEISDFGDDQFGSCSLFSYETCVRHGSGFSGARGGSPSNGVALLTIAWL